MERKIISPQTCDMGHGNGKFLCPNGTTLEDFLKWYKEHSKTWGVITIINREGKIIRKFDYDLYNSNIYYYHLSWERSLTIKEISFLYCWMMEEVEIHLN